MTNTPTIPATEMTPTGTTTATTITVGSGFVLLNIDGARDGSENDVVDGINNEDTTERSYM